VSHELGMGVERIARHDAIFREANDWIGDAAEHHQGRHVDPLHLRCADSSCGEMIPLMLAEYAQIRSDPHLRPFAFPDDGAVVEPG
jgi:hypothetical protein